MLICSGSFSLNVFYYLLAKSKCLKLRVCFEIHGNSESVHSAVGSWELGRNNFKTAIGTYAGCLLILILGTNALPGPFTASASQMEWFGLVYRQDCPTLGKKDQLE